MRIEQCNGDLQLSLDGSTKCLQAERCTLSWQTLSEYSFQIQKQDGSVQMVAPSTTPIQKDIQNGWVWQYDHAELAVEVQYVLNENVLFKTVSVTAATVVGTLTNTALVLTALKLFGGFEILFGSNAKLLTTIFASIVAVNGVIELIAALVLVPSIYMATHKIIKNKI